MEKTHVSLFDTAEEIQGQGFLKLKLFTSVGQGGVGKSTAMKDLALSWAGEEGDHSTELHNFDHIFHIALRKVEKDTPLEKIITAEHSELEANDAAGVKRLLKDKTQRKLVLLDGYDEYKGENDDIDQIILKRNSFPNCWLVLTSRETDSLYPVRDSMDVEARILGFSEENVFVYITRYLGDEESAQALLEQAHEAELWNRRHSHWRYPVEIMTIPILLCMICFLFQCQKSLPNTRCGIYDAIVDRLFIE